MKRIIAIIMTLCLVLGLSSVSVWAAEEAAWQTEPPMPIGIINGCSCTVGDKIYLIGGRTTSEVAIDSVQIYDTKAKIWTSGKSMSTGRENFTATTVGDKIYVIGGNTAAGQSNKLEIYDTKTDTWTTGKPMPTARQLLSSAVVGGKIYVFGGISSNAVEIYDTQTDTWTTGKSMTRQTSGLTSESVGDKIYVIGGNSDGIFDAVEIYDTQTDTWTTGKSMTTGRFYLTSQVVKDKIYAIGGKRGYLSLDTVEIYDTQTDTWTTGKSMTTGRSGASATVVGGKIYAIGGINAGIALSTMESLQVGSTETTFRILSVLLNEGETVQLSTSYNLDNNKNYTWSSTNEAVATVDSNGKVTAVAEGTADIYAQSADVTFKEYIPVKVTALADELRLAVHLKAGEKAKLYLTDDASKVTWSSMDNSIATVSTEGQVTGVKKGLAIVKAELDGQTYQIYVRVNG